MYASSVIHLLCVLTNLGAIVLKVHVTWPKETTTAIEFPKYWHFLYMLELRKKPSFFSVMDLLYFSYFVTNFKLRSNFCQQFNYNYASGSSLAMHYLRLESRVRKNLLRFSCLLIIVVQQQEARSKCNNHNMHTHIMELRYNMWFIKYDLTTSG